VLVLDRSPIAATTCEPPPTVNTTPIVKRPRWLALLHTIADAADCARPGRGD
jgi:hypothetical protein